MINNVKSSKQIIHKVATTFPELTHETMIRTLLKQSLIAACVVCIVIKLSRQDMQGEKTGTAFY